MTAYTTVQKSSIVRCLCIILLMITAVQNASSDDSPSLDFQATVLAMEDNPEELKKTALAKDTDLHLLEKVGYVSMRAATRMVAVRSEVYRTSRNEEIKLMITLLVDGRGQRVDISEMADLLSSWNTKEGSPEHAEQIRGFMNMMTRTNEQEILQKVLNAVIRSGLGPRPFGHVDTDGLDPNGMRRIFAEIVYSGVTSQNGDVIGLTEDGMQARTGRVVFHRAPVYSSIGSTGYRCGYAFKNEQVYIVKEVDGWYQISGCQSCFSIVDAKSVKVHGGSDKGNAKVVIASKTYAWGKHPEQVQRSKLVAQSELTIGDTLVVDGTVLDGGFYKVIWNPGTWWIKKAHVSVGSPGER